MNELHDVILARLPATMKELEAATGVLGQPLWDAVHTLRRAGIIRRIGPHGARVFEKVPPPAQHQAEPGAPQAQPDVSPGVAAAREKKERKRPVILFWIPGWPSQDPNRRMVWQIVWYGLPTAEREIKRLEKKFRKDGIRWELASMSPSEVRRLRTKGFSMTEQRERERMMREKDAAPAS